MWAGFYLTKGKAELTAMPRSSTYWQKQPYDPVIDRLQPGDIILYGPLKRPRKIREVNHHPTDHVRSVVVVKLTPSRYVSPTTVLNRCALIAGVKGVLAEGVSLCMTDLECAVQRDIEEGRYGNDVRIQQHEAVGIIY